MKHKTVRFLAALSHVVLITLISTSLGSAAQASEGSSLVQFASYSLLGSPIQPSNSKTVRDDLERYSLSIPPNWEVTTYEHWDNDAVLKFDALIGLTAPDGEVVTMRMWDRVASSSEESLEIYLRPLLSAGENISRGTIQGNTLYIATKRGIAGRSLSSIFAFVQCGGRAFRFEYITIAGGTQLEVFRQLLKSFQCEIEQPLSSDDILRTVIPVISKDGLTSPLDKWPQNPCQGYWDPNGNRYNCGECTWWANYSRPDIPNDWPNGDARTWNDIAELEAGFDVISTPEQGSIAVWEANSNGAGSAGHVAYVTWVNGDGTFNVTEMNWPTTSDAQPPTQRTVTDTPNINFIVGGVTFFEHINFDGRRYKLRSSEPNLTYGGFEPSSVFIPAGWDTIFYRDTDYGTAAWRHRWGTTTLSALESSFWNLTLDYFSDGSNMNDNVRSVRLSRNSCFQQPSSLNSPYSTNEGCGDAPPDEDDNTPPSASGFSASVTGGRTAEITTSGVQDNSGGSGVREVRFSAKWGGNWYPVGADSSAPYTLSWDMCSGDVPNGDVELGMEVWDNADNKWVWSYGNPHITKDSACGGSGDPSAGDWWDSDFWTNKYLAGLVNWHERWLWDGGQWPYIYFDWGINGPKEGWSGDEFSLRIWRNVYFPGGHYEFHTDSDDGVKVYVDNSVVVDHWWDAGSAAGGRYIPGGWHEVKVEYFENTGNAKLYVVWYGPGYPQPDNSNPDGRISSPTHQSAVSSSPLTIWAEAWDDASGVDYVRFMAHYCQSGDCGWRELGTDGSAPYAHTWNWDSVGEQHVWLAIHVADKSGKVTYDPGGWIEVDLDKTNPTAEISSPTEGSYLTSNSVPIIASASDGGSGVGSVQFFAGYDDNSGNYWHELGSDTDGGNGWQWDWNASGVADQRDVSFFVYVYDRAGNINSSARWANILDRATPTSQIDVLPANSPPSFTVSWSGSDNAAGLASYDIQYQQDGGSWQNWLAQTTETSSTFTGSNGHTYGFRSRARDLAGHVETWPSSADAVTTIDSAIPPAPLNFRATDGELIAEIRLFWDPSPGATSYAIFYSEPGSSEVHLLKSSNGTSSNDGLHVDGKMWAYAVKACSEAGCSDFSNFDTGYADMPMLNPIDNPEGDGAFAVTWVAANTANSYRLEEQKDYSNWTNIYWGNLTSQTVSGKEEGTWCYRVSAHSGIQGDSPWTEPKCTYVGTEVDTVAPVVEWGWPVGNGMTFNATNEEVFLGVEATDNRSVTVVQFSWLDETTNTWQTFAEDTAAPYQHLLDISILPVGCTKVDAMAFDAAGNASSEYIWICAGAEPSWKTFVPTILR